MGTIRYTVGPDGEDLGLYDHEGWIAQIFEDGSVHGGGRVDEVDRRTVAFRAACECGWRGATVVERQPGESAWPEWEDLPVLDAEWTAHTDPLLEALAHPAPRPTAGVGPRVHLHGDDCPKALGVLAVLLGDRDPAAVVAIGYEPTDHGAWVDWDRLERSWLSSTERAAVIVARGVAAAERHGGWPPRLSRVLVDAVGAL